MALIDCSQLTQRQRAQGGFLGGMFLKHFFFPSAQGNLVPKHNPECTPRLHIEGAAEKLCQPANIHLQLKSLPGCFPLSANLYKFSRPTISSQILARQLQQPPPNAFPPPHRSYEARSCSSLQWLALGNPSLMNNLVSHLTSLTYIYDHPETVTSFSRLFLGMQIKSSPANFTFRFACQ